MDRDHKIRKQLQEQLQLAKGKNWISQLSLKSLIRSILLLCAGCTLSAFALQVFYLPNQLIMGGVSGLATLIKFVTQTSIPFGTLTIMLNVPIFLAGGYFISRKFLATSIIGSFAYGFFIDLWEPIFSPLNQYFFSDPSSPDNLILCAVGGSVLYGAGIGLILSGGFTTGGTDIVAILIRRLDRRLSLGQIVWIIDATIILVTAFVFQIKEPGKIKLGLYSAIAVVGETRALDFILEGFNYKRCAFIISEQYELISKMIMEDLRRGVTAIYAKGMYSQKDRPMLCCVVTKKQVPKIKQIAQTCDANSFVFVLESREVVGEGFHGKVDL